jgi:hypothetical protein
VFVEVLMYDYVLRRWRTNPTAPKRSYEAIYCWQDAKPENDQPLTHKDVESMKAWMKRHAPTGYFMIFPEERETDTESVVRCMAPAEGDVPRERP